MECKFVVGQRVVCIAPGNWPAIKRWAELNGFTVQIPRRGGIYTIREIYVDPADHAIGLRFKELVNPLHSSGIEYGFRHYEFAPLTERKTDISIFTKMLGPELVS